MGTVLDVFRPCTTVGSDWLHLKKNVTFEAYLCLKHTCLDHAQGASSNEYVVMSASRIVSYASCMRYVRAALRFVMFRWGALNVLRWVMTHSSALRFRIIETSLNSFGAWASCPAANFPPLQLPQERPSDSPPHPSKAIVLSAAAVAVALVTGERDLLTRLSPPAKRLDYGRSS